MQKTKLGCAHVPGPEDIHTKVHLHGAGRHPCKSTRDLGALMRMAPADIHVKVRVRGARRHPCNYPIWLVADWQKFSAAGL